VRATSLPNYITPQTFFFFLFLPAAIIESEHRLLLLMGLLGKHGLQPRSYRPPALLPLYFCPFFSLLGVFEEDLRVQHVRKWKEKWNKLTKICGDLWLSFCVVRFLSKWFHNFTFFP
jgi:hypothetical protein